jgi:hypothetical protein
MRTLVAGVSGIVATYSAADQGDQKLPMALNALPAALLMPGQTVEYILSPGQQRHTYDVKVQVMTGGPEPGQSAYVTSPMPDAIIGVLVNNVLLGGICNGAVFKSSSGLQGFEYGGLEYTGFEVVIEVSEQGNASPAVGS